MHPFGSVECDFLHKSNNFRRYQLLRYNEEAVQWWTGYISKVVPVRTVQIKLSGGSDHFFLLSCGQLFNDEVAQEWICYISKVVLVRTEKNPVIKWLYSLLPDILWTTYDEEVVQEWTSYISKVVLVCTVKNPVIKWFGELISGCDHLLLISGGLLHILTPKSVGGVVFPGHLSKISA